MTQHICPDCKNVFLQPFRCTTCAAQKLYDTTLRQAEQRAERAEAELAAARALLPSVYYMDPPDGGDVDLIEQLRRMAKDAGRYRWIKKQSIKMATAKDDFSCYDADYTVSILFRKRPPSLNGYILEAPQGNELDAAIDAALDKQRTSE